MWLVVNATSWHRTRVPDLVKLLNNTTESRATTSVNVAPTETTGDLNPLDAATQSSPSQTVGGDSGAPSLLIPSSTTPALSSPLMTDQKPTN